MQFETKHLRKRDGGTVLWTPWGPVPDASARDGKVTRLRPRDQTVRHKNIGFDLRPRDALPSKQ